MKLFQYLLLPNLPPKNTPELSRRRLSMSRSRTNHPNINMYFRLGRRRGRQALQPQKPYHDVQITVELQVRRTAIRMCRLNTRLVCRAMT